MADAKARFRIEGEDATAAAFKSALSNARGAADKMSGAFKTAFAGISVATLAGVVTRSIEMGDELQKAAVKAGVTGKAMSELAFAGKMADVELAAISTSLRFMQKNLSEAASGAQSSRDSLSALGLSVEQLFALSPDRQFELIADRISLLTNPADRARAATELFGKAGAELLPLFEDGAEGIRKAREEAEKFGLAFSDEQLAQFAKADDALKKLKKGFEGVAGAATLALTKGIEGFGKGLADLGSGNFAFDSALNDVRVQAAVDARRAEMEAAGKAGANPFAGARNIFAPGSSGPGGFVNRPAASGGGGSKTADTAALQARRDAFDAMASQLRDTAQAEDQLQQSFEDAKVSADELLKESFDAWVPYFEETSDALEQQIGGITDFSRRAAENMQDAFADFFFDPFQDGLKGMLRGFVDVIRRMVAEQAAAQIFGSKSSGGFGLGELVTGALGSFFGGFRAAGGPVSGGRAYMVGEQGPELFMPRQSGTIVPNGAGGTTSIAPVINIDARGATVEAIQLLPKVAEQAANMAVARVQDMLSRRAMR